MGRFLILLCTPRALCASAINLHCNFKHTLYLLVSLMPKLNPAEHLLDAMQEAVAESVNGILATFRGGEPDHEQTEPVSRKVGFQEPTKPSGPLTMSDIKGLHTKRTDLEVKARAHSPV